LGAAGDTAVAVHWPAACKVWALLKTAGRKAVVPLWLLQTMGETAVCTKTLATGWLAGGWAASERDWPWATAVKHNRQKYKT